MEHVYQTKVPVAEARILKLFVSVCKGLSAMHTCSAGPLAHNDIKVRQGSSWSPSRAVC